VLVEDDEVLVSSLFNLLDLDQVASGVCHATNFWTVFLNYNIVDALEPK
jgi:hypothetical protein